jgi:hydroxymethylpyrimidine pyrophosphatase-like HAD family hydrolase
VRLRREAGRSTTYQALATDYDGTIACDGVVDEATIDALRRASRAGLRLILVTGRDLVSLSNTFAHAKLFDRIVAENGAVLHDPSAESLRTLSPPPPPALLDALQDAKVPISVGHSIVATVTPYEAQLLEAIRALGLRWHIILNKSAVMALPDDVTKASGLAVALSELGLSAARTVGVGDAENDVAFLRCCGLSAAVDNALPEVKAIADVVTTSARGHGVRELLDRLLDAEISDHTRDGSSPETMTEGTY